MTYLQVTERMVTYLFLRASLSNLPNAVLIFPNIATRYRKSGFGVLVASEAMYVQILKIGHVLDKLCVSENLRQVAAHY